MALKEKILTVYFSYSGNTDKIARQINTKVGGDIFELQPVNDYPAVYNDVLAIAKKEIRKGDKPALKETITSLDEYDIIFIGYPNWWGTFPAPVLTFLSGNNFTGKTVIPFCTHGGGGSGHSFTDIAKQCRGAKILEGLSINACAVNNNNSEVIEWLSKY